MPCVQQRQCRLVCDRRLFTGSDVTVEMRHFRPHLVVSVEMLTECASGLTRIQRDCDVRSSSNTQCQCNESVNVVSRYFNKYLGCIYRRTLATYLSVPSRSPFRTTESWCAL